MSGEFESIQECDAEESQKYSWEGKGFLGVESALAAMNSRLIDLEKLICSRENAFVGIPSWWENVKNGACPEYEILMRSQEKIGNNYLYRYFYVPNPIPDPQDENFPSWVTGGISVSGVYPDGRTILVFVSDRSEGESVIMQLHAKTSYPSPPELSIVERNREIDQNLYIPYRIRYRTPELPYGDYHWETKLVKKPGRPNV